MNGTPNIMLQCSKYKTRKGHPGAAFSHRQIFTQLLPKTHLSRRIPALSTLSAPWNISQARKTCGICWPWRSSCAIWQMTRCVRATAHSNLMAADALEKRARWLAAALPEERHNQNVETTPPLPVDLTI
jgi:hypothetical protein